MTAETVDGLRQAGYRPRDFVDRSELLTRVVKLIGAGFFSPDDPSRGAALARYLVEHDPFLACADFDDYIRCQDEVAKVYRNQPVWMRKVVQNIAGMGPFSSDETIRRYARDIWQLEPVPIAYEPGD
jgi:starch phosphorylase